MRLGSGSLLFLSVLAVTSGVALGSADPPLTLDQVPPAVRTTIIRELGEKPAIKTIEPKTSGGQMVFEVEGKRAGSFDVDLRIAEDGTVLKKEEEIPLAELPAAIRTTAEKILGSLPVHEAKKVTRGNQVRYEVEAKTSAGEIELEFEEAGTLRRETRDLDPATLPKPILDTARTHLGEVAISEAARVVRKGKTTYELVGCPGGKEVELEIAEDGTLLEKTAK